VFPAAWHFPSATHLRAANTTCTGASTTWIATQLQASIAVLGRGIHPTSRRWPRLVTCICGAGVGRVNRSSRGFCESGAAGQPQVANLPVGSVKKEVRSARRGITDCCGGKRGRRIAVFRGRLLVVGTEGELHHWRPSLNIVAARVAIIGLRNDPSEPTLQQLLKPFSCRSASRCAWSAYPPAVITSLAWVPVSKSILRAEGKATSGCLLGGRRSSVCGWGDGWGFDKHDGCITAAWLARIEGSPDDLRGVISTPKRLLSEKSQKKERTSGEWGRKPCGCLWTGAVHVGSQRQLRRHGRTVAPRWSMIMACIAVDGLQWEQFGL